MFPPWWISGTGLYSWQTHCLHLCQSKYSSRSSGFLMVRRHHKMERAQKQKPVHICSVCRNTILGLNLWIVRFVLWNKLYSQQQFMFLLKFSIISLWLSHLLIGYDNYNLIGLEGVSSWQLQVTVKSHITTWHVPITLTNILCFTTVTLRISAGGMPP